MLLSLGPASPFFVGYYRKGTSPSPFYTPFDGTSATIPDTACIVGDELDGTIPFARGMRDWGVLLARIEGLPTHGVIFLPAWNLLIAAERSKGCWVNGETVRLSAPVAFNEIVFGTELNPRLTEEHRRRIIDQLSSKTLTTRCLACGAAGFAELILGRTSLYVNCKGVGSGTLRRGP